MNNGRVFTSLREAINHTVYRTGKSAKEIAAELDMSPSALSMAAGLGVENARAFPADDEHLIKLQRVTGDHSVLATMADQLGYELVPKRARMDEIVAELKEDIRKLAPKIQLVLDGFGESGAARKRAS